MTTAAPTLVETLSALQQAGYTLHPTGLMLNRPTYLVIGPKDSLGRRWRATRYADDLSKILAGKDTYFAKVEGK